MDVSRVEAGRLEGLFSPRQLGRLTAGLAALFEGAIRKAGLELVVEWDESEERLVYVDSELWEKVGPLFLSLNDPLGPAGLTD